MEVFTFNFFCHPIPSAALSIKWNLAPGVHPKEHNLILPAKKLRNIPGIQHSNSYGVCFRRPFYLPMQLAQLRIDSCVNDTFPAFPAYWSKVETPLPGMLPACPEAKVCRTSQIQPPLCSATPYLGGLHIYVYCYNRCFSGAG